METGLNEKIIEPAWALSSSLSEWVWSVLYFIIAFSFISVFQKFYKKELPGKVALPFLLNLIFNLILVPLQVLSNGSIFASIDAGLVLITLVWATAVVARHLKWVALVNIPYLLWICYVLAVEIIKFINYRAIVIQ